MPWVVLGGTISSVMGGPRGGTISSAIYSYIVVNTVCEYHISFIHTFISHFASAVL